MRVAVLPDHVLLVVPTEGVALSDKACFEIQRQIREALPDWRAVVFRDGGDIVDMRGDPEAVAAAQVISDLLSELA